MFEGRKEMAMQLEDEGSEKCLLFFLFLTGFFSLALFKNNHSPPFHRRVLQHAWAAKGFGDDLNTFKGSSLTASVLPVPAHRLRGRSPLH